MPSDEAVSSGGLASEEQKPQSLYSLLEGKYYDFIEWLEQAGFPAFKIVDSLEMRGIRTFPIFAILLLSGLALLGYFLLYPAALPEGGSFSLKVFSASNPVERAVVNVYGPNGELMDTATTSSEGSVEFASLPSITLKFVVSADGFEKASRSFDLSLRRKGSVELNCVSPTCLPAVPSPTQSPIIRPIGIKPPILPPVVERTGNNTIIPPLPEAVGLSVFVRNASSGLPVANATVELWNANGIRQRLALLQTDANGLAFFQRVTFGQLVYLLVRANGFLLWDGSALGQTLTVNKDSTATVLLAQLVPGVNSLPTLFKVVDEENQPITAYAEFFVNASDNAYSSATIVREANLLFPAGSRINAIVSKPDNSLIGTGRIAFNSGEPVVTIKLFRVQESSATTCEVRFPSSQGQQMILAPGQRLPVSVVFSKRPTSFVNVSCNGAPAFSSCVASNCTTQCFFESTGTKIVQVLSGSTACTSTAVIKVEASPARSYSLAALPQVIPVGNSSTMTVLFTDSTPPQSVSISCGDGRFVEAPCNAAQGQCVAQCGPYSTPGSKAPFVLVRGEKVASTTLVVIGGSECSIAAVPSLPIEGQEIQVLVQFKVSSPVTDAVVECGSQPKAVPCSGTSGSCTASCSFSQLGSQSIIASLSARAGVLAAGSGGAEGQVSPAASWRASCGTTVSVRQLVGNATFCNDAQKTPARTCSSQQPIYCNSAGSLESRASQCGCPGGWRVSPADPDFCEKVAAVGLPGFSTAGGGIALGQLSNGQISGVSSVLALRQGTAGIFQVQGGAVQGEADALVSYSGGSIVSATLSPSGDVVGASFVIGLDSANKPVVASVSNGKVSSTATKVLVVSSGVLTFAARQPDGTLSHSQPISQVFGVSGGSIEIISLDGEKIYCSDGTLVGQCAAEKPFKCGSDGVKRPDAQKCGCPAGWKPSALDASQCVFSTKPAACADGTLLDSCSASKPGYCSNDALLVHNAFKCGCPDSWKKSSADPAQCIPAGGSDSCSDGTATGKCSAAKPLYCDSGIFEPRPGVCGCPEGFTVQGNDCAPTGPSFTCSDGTARNACSLFKPLFCTTVALLVDKASQCSCPDGWKPSTASPEQCIPVGTADSCPDGTKPGKCASSKPLYCDNGLLKAAAAFCGCPVGWKASPNNPSQCVQVSTEFCGDGTSSDSCSSSKPFFCSAGLLVEQAGTCGCPAGFSVQANSCVCASSSCSQACSDGTPRNSCSQVEPFYCNGQGVLSEKAGSCGCPRGYHSDPGNADKCVKIVDLGTCEDGTLAGACSATKPLYCFGGRLVQRSSQCGCPAGFTVQGSECVPVATALLCSDGTAVGACSSSKPFYCNAIGDLAENADGSASPSHVACGCPSGWKPSATDASQCVPSTSNSLCQDGTPTGSCSLSKPFYCDNGLLEKRAGKCGCAAGFLPKGDSCLPISPPTQCSDGTLLNQCSTNKPFLCNQQGDLVEKADQCGCPSGWQASSSDSTQCVPVGVTQCSDGTAVGSCSSAFKPLYCDHGILEEKAGRCGCPANFEVVGDSCIPITSPKKCGDGTALSSCSRFEPLYCSDAAALSTRADLCGCPYGWRPDPADSRQCIAKHDDGLCFDGTRSGVCSSSAKPLYCLGGAFFSKASECGCPAGFSVQGDACVPIGPPGLCSDGTAKNACSRFKPLFCTSSATLIESAAQCGCADGWRQSTVVASQCVPIVDAPSCFDGTSVGVCSSAQPFYCASNLTLVSNAGGGASPSRVACGCPARMTRNGDLCYLTPTCEDGTSVGACSQARGKPLFCGFGGQLEPLAFQCGCNPGFHVNTRNPSQCEPDGCEQLGSCNRPCADGTQPNSCSASKPLFCNSESNLVEKAGSCGCPANLIVSGNSCVLPPFACSQDGTLFGQCSLSQSYGAPFYCNGGVLEPKATRCGCGFGFEPNPGLPDQCRRVAPPLCADGSTVPGNCKVNDKPWYCSSTTEYSEKASVCGCPAERPVRAGDSCFAVGNTCPDGTAVGQCKAGGQPLYCNAQLELVSNADGSASPSRVACGCPAGMIVAGSACVPEGGQQSCVVDAFPLAVPSSQPANLMVFPFGFPQVPPVSQVLAYCDSVARQVATLTYDGQRKAFVGSCSYPSSAGPSKSYAYSASISSAQSTVLCSFNPPGRVLVEAARPTLCLGTGGVSVAEGACDPVKPMVCTIQGDAIAGYSPVFIEKASVCHCPARYHEVGELCAPDFPPDKCIDNTPAVNTADTGDAAALGCSQSAVKGKPFLCLRNPVDSFIVDFVEKASVCGCPAGKVKVAESCVTPSGQLDVALAAYQATVLQPVNGNVFLSNSNFFSASQSLAGLGITCGGNVDGSGVGSLSFNYASCSAIEGGVVSCPFSCVYAIGQTGIKRVNATLSIAGSSFSALSQPFEISGFPPAECSISVDGVNVVVPPQIVKRHLGESVTVNVSFKTSYNGVTGVRQLLAGPASNTYDFSCGTASSPTLGVTELRSVPQIECSGSEGVCTAACVYKKSDVDLSKTPFTNPWFRGFKDNPQLNFACGGPTVQFDDTPAVALVSVKYCLERQFNSGGSVSCKTSGAVPGATVTLREVGGGSQECDTVPATPANGNVLFSQCKYQDSNLKRNLLKGTPVEAVAQAEVYDSAGSKLLMTGSASGQLLLSQQEGTNNFEVFVDFPYATVSMDVVDRFTGLHSPDLANAVSTVSCPAVDLSASPLRLGSVMSAQSSCTGSTCTLSTRAYMGACIVGVEAPGYRGTTAGQPFIDTPGGSASIHVELFPSTYNVNSFNSLSLVYDVEGAFGQAGNLDLSALSLKKGFRYKVQTLVQTVDPTTKVAAFFKASDGQESFVYGSALLGGALVSNAYLAASSVGHPSSPTTPPSTSPDACSTVALDYGNVASPSKFQWVELAALNARSDGKSLVPAPEPQVKAEFDLLPVVGAATSSRLSSRSYTDNTTSFPGKPRFVLNAYDPDSADSFAHPNDRLPLCTALPQDRIAYSLVESTRACSPDFAYCIENEFTQNSVSSLYRRGDGFQAQSAELCSSEKPEHCVNVSAEFTLSNNDAGRLIDSGYEFSMQAEQGRYEVLAIVFYKGTNSITLTNQGDLGALVEKKVNSFRINLDQIYSNPLMGGVPSNPKLSGRVILKPLAPTGSQSTTLVFTFSSASKQGAAGSSLSQRTTIIPRTTLTTRYGTVFDAFAQQQEQFDSGRAATPYASLRSQALSDSNAFEAEVADCVSGQKGWGCREVELKFSATLFQSFNNARLLYDNAGQSFQLAGYAFTITSPTGASVFKSARQASSGSSAEIALGRQLNFGDTISVVLYVRPPSLQVAQERVTFGLKDGSNSDSVLQVGGKISAAKRNGVLKIVARDALTGQLVPGVVFDLQYGGATGSDAGSPSLTDLASCQFSSEDSCLYRLRPISWRQPSCVFDSQVFGAGCGRVASAPAGYLPAFVKPVLEQTENEVGLPVFGSVAPGETREITFYLMRPVSQLSLVQSVSIVKASDEKPACLPHSTNALVPDCYTQVFYLQRGEKYKVSMIGTMRQSAKGGVYLSAGSGTSQSRITAAPAYLSTDISVNEKIRCVVNGPRTVDGKLNGQPADIYCYNDLTDSVCVVAASQQANYCELNLAGRPGQQLRWRTNCAAGEKFTMLDGRDEQIVFDCSGGVVLGDSQPSRPATLNWFAGGSQAGACSQYPDDSGRLNLNSFLKNLPDLLLEENKWNWLQIISDNSGRRDFQFQAEYDVLVDASASGDLPFSLNSFASVLAVDGKEVYSRSPDDLVLGNAWSKLPERQWCAAEAVRLRGKAIPGSTRCNAFACVSLQYSQGLSSTSLESNPAGFPVLSKDLSLAWSDSAPGPLKIKFFVDVLQDSASKSVALEIGQPQNLQVNNFKLTKFCAPQGVGVEGKQAPQSTPGKFVFDASGCSNIGGDSDIVGEFEADALTGSLELVEKLVSLSVSYSGDGKLSKQDSSVRVVPPAISATSYSIISASAFQNFSGLSISSVVCGTGTGDCAGAPFYSTFGQNCEQNQFVDNTFRAREGTKCASSWIEINYRVKTLAPASSASLHFKVAPGETIVPDIPASLTDIPREEETEAAFLSWLSTGVVAGTSTDAAVLPERIVCKRESNRPELQFQVNPCTISRDGKLIDVRLGSLARNAEFVLSVRVDPRSAGQFNPSLTFSNGQSNTLAVPMWVAGQKLAPFNPAFLSELYPQFPCGRADLLISASSKGPGNPVAGISCSNGTLIVDPLAPFDGLPLAIDSSLRTLCIGQSDPFASGLFGLEPVSLASLPAGSRQLQPSDFKPILSFSDSAGTSNPYWLVRFDGAGFGPNNDLKITQGNSLVWPGENAPIPPDTEIGRINLKVHCTQASPNILVPIILRSASTYHGVVDASAAFYSDQPHQLAWALYNGQEQKLSGPAAAPRVFKVLASNEPGGRVLSIPIEDGNRVHYFLTNKPNSGLKMSGSYPIAVYPELPLTSSGFSDVSEVERYGGVLLSENREASITGELLGNALSDPRVSAQFNQVVAGFETAGRAGACTEVDKRSYVQSLLPAYFREYAKRVASETVFKRTEPSGRFMYAGFEKRDPPFYCNSAGLIVLDSVKCGCPQAFSPTVDGNCQAIGKHGPVPSEVEERIASAKIVGAPTKCADGSLPGTCSKYSPYYCNQDLFFEKKLGDPNAGRTSSSWGCGSEQAAGPQGYCGDVIATNADRTVSRTPVGSCLRDSPQLKREASLSGWLELNNEQQLGAASCNSCVPVQASSDPAVVTSTGTSPATTSFGYAPDAEVASLSVSGVNGKSSLVPSGYPGAVEVYEPNVNIMAKLSPSVAFASPPRPVFTVQYQRPGRLAPNDCVVGGGKWCEDSMLFESGTLPSLEVTESVAALSSTDREIFRCKLLGYNAQDTGGCDGTQGGASISCLVEAGSNGVCEKGLDNSLATTASWTAIPNCGQGTAKTVVIDGQGEEASFECKLLLYKDEYNSCKFVGSGETSCSSSKGSCTVPAGSTLVSTYNSFTVSFWAKPAGTRASTLEAASGVTGNVNQKYALWPAGFVSSDTALAGISVGTNGVSVFEHKDNYLPSLLVYDTPINDWTLVTVVYDNKQPKLYLNGAWVKDGLASTMSKVRPGFHLGYQGAEKPSYGHYAGSLDEFKVWGRSLSPGEVQQAYAAEQLGTRGALPPGLVASLSLDGNALDASGGNNGILGGGADSYSPTHSPNCKVGGCYSFDGRDDHIALSISAACGFFVQGTRNEQVVWSSGCSSATKTTVVDGQGEQVVFDCSGSTDVKTIDTGEPVLCQFLGTAGGESCYSSKGSCTSAAGANYCHLAYSGAYNQKVTWYSSCVAGSQETVIDGSAEKITFDCLGGSASRIAAEAVRCQLNNSAPGGSCSATSGSTCTVSSQNNCYVGVPAPSGYLGVPGYGGPPASSGYVGVPGYVGAPASSASLTWISSCDTGRDASVSIPMDGRSRSVSFDCAANTALAGTAEGVQLVECKTLNGKGKSCSAKYQLGTRGEMPSGVVALLSLDADASDISGGGNDGILGGGDATASPAYSANCKVYGCYSFAGGKDFVSLNPEGTISKAFNSFTVSFWARPTATRASTDQADSGVTGHLNQRYAVFPSFNADQSIVSAGVSVGTNGVSVFEHQADYLPSLLVHNSPISDWTLVTVVYDNKQPKLYLNGAWVKDGLTSTKSKVRLGRHLGYTSAHTPGYGHYQGDLDELRVWNRALSASEVQAAYNIDQSGSRGQDPSGIAASLYLDGNTIDSTGGGNDGVLEAGSAAPSYVSNCKIGGCVSFDANDFLRIKPGTVQHLSNSFAVSFWARPTATRASTVESNLNAVAVANDGAQKFALFPSFPSDPASFVSAGVSVGTNGISVFEHGANYAPSTLVYNPATPFSDWVHVVVVYDNKKPKLYVNGEWVKDGVTSTKSLVRPGLHLGYADAYTPGYGHYQGDLDEFKVWDHALDAREAQSLYYSDLASSVLVQERSSSCAPPYNADSCQLLVFGKRNQIIEVHSECSSTPSSVMMDERSKRALFDCSTGKPVSPTVAASVLDALVKCSFVGLQGSGLCTASWPSTSCGGSTCSASCTGSSSTGSSCLLSIGYSQAEGGGFIPTLLPLISVQGSCNERAETKNVRPYGIGMQVGFDCTGQYATTQVKTSELVECVLSGGAVGATCTSPKGSCAIASAGGSCVVHVLGTQSESVSWTSSCSSTTQTTTIDGQGEKIAFDCTGPQTKLVQDVQYVQCVFQGLSPASVASCISQGANSGCSSAAGSSSCSMIVRGTPGQLTTWTSTCSSETKTTTMNGKSAQIVFNCGDATGGSATATGTKAFSIPTNNAQSGGLWVVRVKADYTDPLGVAKSKYSEPKQVVVSLFSQRACFDKHPSSYPTDPATGGPIIPAAEAQYTCLSTSPSGRCSSQCSNGKLPESVSLQGAGAVSGVEFRWKNATEVRLYAEPQIRDRELYAGTPYKHFVSSPQAQPFTYALPLMLWGSNNIPQTTLPNWNLRALTDAGYRLLNSACTEATGFYELQAKSATGLDDWQFTAKLDSLPLNNYLLNTEPLEAGSAGQFDASKPIGFYYDNAFCAANPASCSGCSIHTENSNWDWSTVASSPLGKGGYAQFWNPSSPLASHEKPLCNLKMGTFGFHNRAYGGAADCLQMWNTKFGGNCASCPLPGCRTNSNGVLLPTCAAGVTPSPTSNCNPAYCTPEAACSLAQPAPIPTPTSTPTQYFSTCFDSDRGRAYTLRGTASGLERSARVPYSFQDWCPDSNTLRELFCVGDRLSADNVNCAQAVGVGSVCQDGACTAGQPPLPQPPLDTCTDTDGGIDLYVRGTTTATAGLGGTDYCSSASTLFEYYCMANGVWAATSIPCPSGTACQNGACV